MNCKQSLAVTVVGAVMSSMMAGCSTDECEGNLNTLPLAGFYSSQPVPQAISIDSVAIYGVGAPNDSILLQSLKPVSEVYMPFRLDESSTTYAIEYLHKDYEGLTDEITFDYEATPFFVSMSCGVSYRFHIKNIRHTHVLIDSVSVPGNIIDNTNTQNIRIYFRVNAQS